MLKVYQVLKAFSNSGVSGSGLGDTAAGVRSAMDATKQT